MKFYSARYCLAVLLSFGLGVVYGLKVNYHVAVVAMVNHTGIARESGQTSSTDASEDGPFLWSHTTRGLQLSAYFWGYMVAQLPGGRLAEMISAKWVFFFSVAINIVFTLLTPVLAYVHAYAIVVVRIFEGIGGGVSFPATHVMLARWSHPLERSSMSSIAYCGTAAGTVIFTLVSGVIAGKLGWQWVFYLEGGISCVWMIFWVVLVADYPEQQKFISEEEKSYIVDALKEEGGGEHEKKKVPWKNVSTSMPFYAILVAHVCSNWGWYMVLIELPTYMKDILVFNITNNAVLSSIPYLSMFLFSLALGKAIDSLRKNGKITTTTGRKVATSIASVVPCICFCALCFITTPTPAVVLMTISIMCIGGMYSGFLSNHIDLSPNFAGTLMGLTNTIATIPGITVPIFVGWLSEGDPTIASWRIVFYVTIALYVIEFTFYIIFASGEVQPWNQISTTTQN